MVWQVDPDKAFAVQMAHEESVLNAAQAYMQCALLYTSSQGERRIRWACPFFAALIQKHRFMVCWGLLGWTNATVKTIL